MDEIGRNEGSEVVEEGSVEDFGDLGPVFGVARALVGRGVVVDADVREDVRFGTNGQALEMRTVSVVTTQSVRSLPSWNTADRTWDLHQARPIALTL